MFFNRVGWNLWLYFLGVSNIFYFKSSQFPSQACVFKANINDVNSGPIVVIGGITTYIQAVPRLTNDVDYVKGCRIMISLQYLLICYEFFLNFFFNVI